MMMIMMLTFDLTDLKNCILQSLLNSLQSELDSLKDSSLHQRRRITDMMMSLLRDLSDIGTIVGGDSAETKVGYSDTLKMRLVVRKPVFGVSDQVRHKPTCTATEDG